MELTKMLEPFLGGALALISKSALLLSESAAEFDTFMAALVQEIKPHGIIEHMYVAETARIIWETLRLHRCKAAMIDAAFRAALEKLLIQFWKKPDEMAPYEESEALAFEWFTDPKAKQEVAEILGKFNLDESTIEAEAIRSLAPELEMLDRMLRSLEVRRDRAIRGIADYRKSFADQVQEVSDRILNTGPLLQLGNTTAQKTA
jgi:hypothetical protein